jgi:hypothetical protein
VQAINLNGITTNKENFAMLDEKKTKKKQPWKSFVKLIIYAGDDVTCTPRIGKCIYLFCFIN